MSEQTEKQQLDQSTGEEDKSCPFKKVEAHAEMDSKQKTSIALINSWMSEFKFTHWLVFPTTKDHSRFVKAIRMDKLSRPEIFRKKGIKVLPYNNGVLPAEYRSYPKKPMYR